MWNTGKEMGKWNAKKGEKGKDEKGKDIEEKRRIKNRKEEWEEKWVEKNGKGGKGGESGKNLSPISIPDLGDRSPCSAH